MNTVMYFSGVWDSGFSKCFPIGDNPNCNEATEAYPVNHLPPSGLWFRGADLGLHWPFPYNSGFPGAELLSPNGPMLAYSANGPAFGQLASLNSFLAVATRGGNYAIYFPSPVRLLQSNPIDPMTGFQAGNFFFTDVPSIFELSFDVRFLAGAVKSLPPGIPAHVDTFSYPLSGVIPPSNVGATGVGMFWVISYFKDGILIGQTSPAAPVNSFFPLGALLQPLPFSTRVSSPPINVPFIPPGHVLEIIGTFLLLAEGDDGVTLQTVDQPRPDVSLPLELTLPPGPQTNIAANGFNLNLLCDSGETYQLQFSSNLVDWTTVQTIVAASNQIPMVDYSGQAGEGGFYRAVLLPGGLYGTNFVVHSAAGANGQITPFPTVSTNLGANVTFTATPDSNYMVGQWFVDNQVMADGGTNFTVTNVQSSVGVLVTFQPANDLALAVTPPVTAAAVAVVSNQFSFLVTVTNDGVGTIHNVMTTNSIASAVNLISVIPSQGTVISSNNGLAICALGDLAPGAAATVTVTISPATYGELAFTASGGGTDFEPNTDNNFAASLITIVQTPIITQQPQPQSVVLVSNGPASATFSVSATNVLPVPPGWAFDGTNFGAPASPGILTYQWQFNGTNISGAINSALTISNVSSTNVGSYTVVVANAATNVTSIPAALTLDACVTPPSGLVSWWPGDGSAADIAGANNGVLQGGITFTNGEVGQAFNLDGASGWVDVPNSASLNPTGPFSVEVWIQANSSQTSAQSLIVDKSHGWTDATGWALQSNPDGTVEFFYGIGGPTGDPAYFTGVSTTNSVLDNQWHHLAGVFTGTQIQIYLDGVQQGTLNQTILPVNNQRDVEIGRSWGGGSPTRYFHGLIDEVSYYNGTLSPAQVSAIYNAGIAGKCK